MEPEDRAAFDELLESVLEGLPSDLRALLEEVPLLVDDEPSRDVLRVMGIRARAGEADLCGMHWGVPIPDRSVTQEVPELDRIHLFRGPILRLAGRGRRERLRQIRITLLHEIGHHFGLDEDRLEELGYG
ncbi:MAG: metallopeptidase family protein [Bdellovibrionales bacterium]|nr:metallopeptidase family protein [Bdellovibrionales bacterium]